MTDEFSGGDPSPLSHQDYEKVAQELGCTVAAIKAVAAVESSGAGYFSDGRPKILFERHQFYKRNGKRFSSTHPHISWPSGGGYIGGTREYDRLKEAITLDRAAALQSVSWGRFQVMGFNHKLVGWSDLEKFVRDMVSGEAAHLKAFVGYIKATGLADELIRLDWEGFARGYNGPEFRRFDYHTKMANAYRRHSQGGSRIDNPMALLKIGARGQPVMHLQELLGITQDGDFGPATKDAVIAFQKTNKLYADGVVGQQTWTLLLTKPSKKKNEGAGETDQRERTRPPLRQGDRGDDVRMLQELLDLEADGIFGSGTDRKVRAFQKDKGLKDDGIVGRNTWTALLAEEG
ncbi:MAG: DUF3380 domain-containing protein [Sphingomonadales bacterium]|nr:DUF3380 domain-containing protein [Sphingomonadales bacterium]NCO49888.1 DUF3380 domain-containing protein [Sphingomonadales bacterium]NCO98619.1 DUF3380 domain-containing protein [Sphingomonadales bacterium]NCP42915.1 DUF3380 domain-containing protein [Sphingomonadales bacterium]NCP50625.1 DUF3380 domain-containing protein [Sphingomonadales bacterium]